MTESSQLNSDTSQEILKYQKEWAMKFHEHVGQQQQNMYGMQAAGDQGVEMHEQSSSHLLS